MEKETVKMAHANHYDWRDIIRREAVVCAGPIKMAAYRVMDPDTGEHSPMQFHLTYDNMVMAVLGESAAKMLSDFIMATLQSHQESGIES